MGKLLEKFALLNQYEVIDFFDDDLGQFDTFPFTIVNKVDQLKDHLNDYDACFIAIGDNQIRSNKIKWLKNFNVNIVSLIHPKSTISKFSSLGTGSCVMANAVINPGTSINEGVIINTSVSVDHDCKIEDFVHISPNASFIWKCKNWKNLHTWAQPHRFIQEFVLVIM